MRTLLLTLWFVGLVGWAGAGFFFSLVVLPVLFSQLGASKAGPIAAQIFPFYYPWGFWFGVVTLVASAALAFDEGGLWRAAVLVVVVMLACQAYGGFVVYPQLAGQQMTDLRDALGFQALHVRSMRLNAVVLVGAAILCASSGLLAAGQGARKQS